MGFSHCGGSKKRRPSSNMCGHEAIRRVRHPIPTVNDISFALNGAKFFSKLELSQAYHQLELHKQSRYVTTFSTHVGLYHYKSR